MFVAVAIFTLALIFILLPITLWLGAKSEAGFYKKRNVELVQKSEYLDKTNDFLWRKMHAHEKSEREYLDRASEVQKQALRISELQAENSRLKIATGATPKPTPSDQLN